MKRASPGAVLAVLLGGACAHKPAIAPAPAEVVWPEIGGAARVRLALVVPDARKPAKIAWWRRAWNAIVGLDDSGPERAIFVRPFGVASCADGEIVVADPDVPSISRVRRDGAVEPISCSGGEWVSPMAVALGEDGSLWVADGGAAAVVRRAPDGRCSRFGSDVLERPTGIALGGGRVFVADPPRHEVVVLTTEGVEVGRIGGRGEDEGQLSFPAALALDRDGNLLVVDSLNFRIARFSADGRWLGSFGAAGEEGGSFARPKGVATGPDGRIYVTDAQRDAVLVFLPDGSFDYAIGASGSEAGRFVHPAGIAVRDGRIYVADSHNGRVQAFDILGGGS